MTTGADKASAARQAATAAGAEAGPGPSDSVVMACSLLRVGIFFDGTGNFRNSVGQGGFDTWHTNVDLLERKYIQLPAAILPINGQRRDVTYFSRYMRGIGMQADGDTTNRGLASGTGGESDAERVPQALSLLLADFRRRTGAPEITCIVHGETRPAKTLAKNLATAQVEIPGLHSTHQL